MNKPNIERRQDYVDIAVMQERINSIYEMLTEMKQEKKEYRQLIKINLDEIEDKINDLSKKVSELEKTKAKLLGLSAGVSIASTSLLDKLMKLF